MIVTESRAGRRLLVRVEEGEELLSTLVDLAHDEGVTDAWIRGLGTLASAEIEPEQRFLRCRILTLEGTLSMRDGEVGIRLHVTLSRPAKDGVVGGVLTRGESLGVDLVVVCYEDLGAPAVRGTSAWVDEEEDEDPNGSTGAAVVSWADVAAVSAAPEVAPVRGSRASSPDVATTPRAAWESEVAELIPGKGDFIQHRQFGLCKVERDSKGGGIVIKLPSGVRKTLRLDFLDVGAPRLEGSRRVFLVRPRKR